MAEYRFEDIAINSTEKKKPVESDKEHYLGLEHLDSGTFKVSRFGSEVAPIGDKLIMKKGDVLFGKRRAYQKKVAIAPFDGIFSAHGMVLRPKEDVIDKNFFPLFIASDYFLDAAIKISVGSLSPTINWRDLKELKFNLPDLDEQKKRAEILWQIVATMESYKKLLAKTDEMIKAKFVEMFGKKSFEITTLGNECSLITKGTTPTSMGFDFIESGINFIKIENIDEAGNIKKEKIMHISEECNKKMKRSQLNCEDILFSIAGAIGRTAIITAEILPANTNQALAIIRLKKESCLNTRFLAKVLTSDYIKKQYLTKQRGIAQINLSLDDIAHFTIPIPNKEKQLEYVNFVEKSEESKAAIHASLESLSAVYKKIIAENLGGSN